MTARPEPDKTDERDESSIRRVLATYGFFIALGVAIVTGIAVAAAGIDAQPGWSGWISGASTGLFAGLLVAVMGAWTAISLMRGPKRPDPVLLATGDALGSQLADPLEELEASRKDVVRRINRRALFRVPLGAMGGLALWVAGVTSGDPVRLDVLAIYMVIAGTLGYGWASSKLSADYDRAYKERVLPALARSLGGLTYTLSPSADTDALKRERLFREFDRIEASDGFSGVHRGLTVFICQLRLSSGGGETETIAFDGLLLQLDLPRRLSGTTAIIHDAGGVGNFRDRHSRSDRERIRLEDPVFERRYEVYGTDQVEARALLNPAFMERFLALGSSTAFGAPQALAHGSRLTLTLPKRIAGDLFRPPGFQKSAACRETLGRLQEDLLALLAAADAAIGLDAPDRLESSPAPRPTGPLSSPS